ncbi:MAG: glycosyltransferase [Burkholderiaceae bacterium]|nr:glycosyltransferase [Burkholderiaceae bacterium]
MNVLFVLPRMVGGGVERVTLNLAAALRQRGVECRLALRRAEGEMLDEAQQIFASVEVLADASLRQFVPRLTALIETAQPTHIVTAFADVGLLTWIARRRAGAKVPIIHGIHNTHAFANQRQGVSGLLRYAADRLFSRLLYPRVDAIVCVSKGIEAEVKACCPSAASYTRTIYNPVASKAQIAHCLQNLRPREPQVGPWRIVGLGRLTAQKGFDVLIKAAGLLPASPDWLIDIYGDGPLRAVLHQSIQRHGLEGRVTLCGYTADPAAALELADVFVLPSRHEGFGLVLVEAMLHGAQVIAADCPQGPREILDGGRFGQLVPVGDAAALAAALQRTLTLKVWINPSALQDHAARFSTEASVAQWLAVIQSRSGSIDR